MDLEVAQRWDAIIQRAERNDVALQMTLQHHGQYSSTVNPNWDENPYNAKNGGFLSKPEEFFTNEQAKSLTKRKLRYAVARWGYSPSILAWELFNEVQFTDAARQKMWPEIAAWHREMATFLREQDPFKHLITTSSVGDLTPDVWADMDFIQEHSYPSDLIVALGKMPDEKWKKPFFVGEFGPANLQDEGGKYLHAGLWASLMSGNGGAAQYWDWDAVEKQNLYAHFEGAAQFVRASGLGKQSDLQPSQPALETGALGEMSFGPGGGWGDAKQNEFLVETNGAPAGISALPTYFQGENHRAMNPKPLRFTVNFAKAGKFTVQLSQVAKAGAHLMLGVNNLLVERDFPATENDTKLSGDDALITLDVPAGRQVVTLQNTGQDWVVIERIRLSDYSAALAARAIGDGGFWAAWVYGPSAIEAPQNAKLPALTGTLAVTGLRTGRYRATWMNTLNGQTLLTSPLQIGKTGSAQIATPLIQRDAVVFIVPTK